MQFRHERKYKVGAQIAEILRGRVAAVLKPDSHSGGLYVVNNLYLDDQFDSFYYEKVHGKLIRDKLRVRFYNGDLSFIRLERKHKEGEFIGKESVSLTQEQYDAIKNGDLSFLSKEQAPLLQQVHRLHILRRLRPVAEFSYLREAFTYDTGNVRITFDSKIGTMGAGPANIPAVFDADGYFDGIMELKFDGFLPSVIENLLDGLPLVRTEMSKYCFIRERGIRSYV